MGMMPDLVWSLQLHVHEAIRGSHRRISVFQFMGTPCHLSRYLILAPAAILIELGVRMRDPSQLGVISPRFLASEKKANTSSRGRGSHCSRLSV
jgi:hypothetical protein